MKNKIEILSDRDHVLLRPSMYVGAMDETEISDFIVVGDGEKIEYTTIKYIPAFVKIIDEIITNSIDDAIRNGFKKGNVIKVSITADTITVEDNGGGIPVVKESTTGEYMPVLAWGRAKSGANFNDDERVTIGLNGVGSFATNVFSTKFTGETCDGNSTLRVSFRNNAENPSVNVRKTPGSTTFTRVTFHPDLSRFRLETIPELYVNIIRQKLINFSISYPEIVFKFNGGKINIKRGKGLLELFGCPFEHVENNRCIIGILPNQFDDFKHYSFVNGLRMSNGGNHVDFLMNEIIPGIREKFKKYDLKPGDIRNKLVLVCFMKNFPNAKFDSQTKERLTNGTKEISEFFGTINIKKLAGAICRNHDIIDPVIETFKIKEEMKDRLSINKLGKVGKNVRCDKYIPSIKNNKYFVIAEGLSATNSLMPILGREDFGFFSCRGVPLNSYEASMKKMLENEELSNIIQILGMKIGDDAKSRITFDNILLAQDADLDGSKIKGLLIGFFNRFAPQLFSQHRIKNLKTPIIVLKHHGIIKKFFFTFDEYNRFMKTHGTTRFSIEYKKGLGSWKMNDLKTLISENGLPMFIEDLDPDAESDKLIHDWLSKDTSDVRKEYLRENNFNIFSI